MPASRAFDRTRAPRSPADRELAFLEIFTGVPSFTRLCQILGIMPTNGMAWLTGDVQSRSVYAAQLLHLYRLRILERGEGTLPPFSRFLDDDYDWDAHWRAFDRNEDVAHMWFSRSQRVEA